MKKIIFILTVLVAGITFYSCEKYTFIEEEIETKTHETKIMCKSAEAGLITPDTLPLNSAIIFFAETLYGNPYEFNWEFGNGDNASGEQVTYKYQETGHYTITLKSYDGQSWSLSSLDIVITDNYVYLPLFSLHEIGSITPEGKMEYTFKFLKDAIPFPVPENGPFFYTGSNPESNWNRIMISSTDDTWCYYSYASYDNVYSQAFGGMYNGNPIWGDMSTSEYYDSGFEHIRAGLQSGQLKTEQNWEKFIPGDTGDIGDYPAIRISTTPDSIFFYADIRNYAGEGINWPKLKYKLAENDQWSPAKETSFIGGSGYVEFSMKRSSEDKYLFNFFKDWENCDQPIDYSSSVFYNEEGYLYFEIVSLK